MCVCVCVVEKVTGLCIGEFRLESSQRLAVMRALPHMFGRHPLHAVAHHHAPPSPCPALQPCPPWGWTLSTL